MFCCVHHSLCVRMPVDNTNGSITITAPERGLALLEGQHPVEGAGAACSHREHDPPLRQGQGAEKLLIFHSILQQYIRDCTTIYTEFSVFGASILTSLTILVLASWCLIFSVSGRIDLV